MMKEAKRLHALGFAIHWLRPNSKKPIENAWTTGERKTWDQLRESHFAGCNVGVRLGAASKLSDDTFLAVVDCDVKSTDAAHLAEMEEKLKTLLANIKGPQVASGRGNGSKHFYVRTEKPVTPFRFSQSSTKVKVEMPSIKASKQELLTLSPEEIAKGIRLRAAWEISVMGEGQQVVLPPSIHPDSGRAYIWSHPLYELTDIPLAVFQAPEKKGSTTSGPVTFTPVEVDLVGSKLSDRMVNLILTGEGCDDRSAGLMSACIAMVKTGMNDDEILSVLTDRSTFLGEAGYEHRQTTNRNNAALWVKKYTLDKARYELSAARDFEDEMIVEDAPPLTEEQVKTQAEEIQRETSWLTKLERSSPQSGGKLKNTMKNVHLILVNAVSPKLVSRNLLSFCDHYTHTTPWGSRKGDAITDIDVVRIKHWMAERFGLEPSDDRIFQAISMIADTNKYHPVRDYLNPLKWDNKPRIDTWLKDYLGAEGPTEYLQEISRKVLVAMVKRVYEPGSKFDQVLILEGKQGCGKSSAVRILGGEWFTDAHINIADKDAVMAIRSRWAIELGELSSMRRADIDMLKSFITQGTDRIRVPYGRMTEEFPRQCVFIGTTNNSEYLKDATGNRRFWPVAVKQCLFDELERDRDQLFAEAKFAYELGEKVYLDSDVAKAQAAEIQGDREVHDDMEEYLADFFKIKKGREEFPVERFQIHQLYGDFGAFPKTKMTNQEMGRIKPFLRKLGYKEIRDKERRRWWIMK